jgi:hypothetical protein
MTTSSPARACWINNGSFTDASARLIAVMATPSEVSIQSLSQFLILKKFYQAGSATRNLPDDLLVNRKT